MPLEDSSPKIDDRSYEDILTEIRTRIPRYTPEWTDFNDSDPGMALAQVFAWLGEMLIYRLNKVPALNYLKFLQLLGIELNPAEPAVTEITFPLLDSCNAPYIIIPERTQVSAEATGGEAPVIFETERAIYALAARLKSVQVFDGYSYTDISSQNNVPDPDQGFKPLGQSPSKDCALMLGFSCDKEFPAELQFSLMVWVFEEATAPSAVTCNLPETSVSPQADIAWEFWNGSQWCQLNFLKDETAALTRSGYIYLKTPLKGQVKPGTFGEVKEEMYWIRVRVKRSGYEKPPRLFAIRTNTVTASQGETVLDEVLGGSDGRPNQVFRLSNVPVLRDSLELEVNEEDTKFESWTRMDDFFGSSADDKHYILNRTTGDIMFGDGKNGRIPLANPENPGSNIVARQYRFGGGKRGNVAAGSLKTLLTPVSGVDDNGVTNLKDSYNGRDEESLEEAEVRAKRSLKSKCRAVTLEDFEALAMESSNIKRAKALPLCHPKFPGVQVPGVITVVVVPDSDEPNPVPSEGTMKTVCAYLNQRRLLTTEIYVTQPTYKKVEIEVEVIADDNADLAEVNQEVEKTLLNYFHPLKGGENNQGWPFGERIYFSKVYQRIFTVNGVSRIETLVIKVEGEEAPECKDVQIPAGALVYSTQHTVRANYSS